jgi:acetyl esterase/lipase
MTIDPRAKRLLDMMRAGGAGGAGACDVARLSPAAMRQSFLDLARSIDATDEPIGEVCERRIPGPAGPLRLRIYSPAAAPGAEQIPGLVYFHGGAWVFGSLDTHEGVCRILANAASSRVVSVDYRLAPEHRFPAALEDSFAATRWVAAHAHELGIAARRLAVAGDSAGATLVAAVCQLARQANGPPLALQLLLCPVMGAELDTESRRVFAHGYFLDQAMMRWAFDHYRPLDAPVNGNPLMFPLEAADFRRLPPAHVHTAEFDPLRDEGALYADKLREAGVAVDYTCHAGMVHHFYGMAGAVPRARAALQSAGAAAGRALA